MFYLDGKKPHLWCTSPLKDLDFSEDMTSFYAQDCAVELSADGKTYTIKSMNNKKSLVNLTLTRTAPGFMAGTDGKTLYGTDFKNPWGSMEHAFWPRCVGEGTITTPEGPIEFKGRAFFVKALQGMKPHHAAAQWNFLTFQAPNVSAVMMEFTTPPSYGATVVTVGGIAKDGEIITAGAQTPVVHSKTKVDPETKWSAPQTVKFAWNGKSKDGKPVAAVLEGDLEDHLDRMDIMSEVPAFVKQIVGATVGTKPYIYQVCQTSKLVSTDSKLTLVMQYTPTKQKLSLKLKIGEEPEIVEQGQIFSEATFISSTTEE